jgi:hypothetical protein
MSVNTIDYEHLIFVVKELWQWTRQIDGIKRIMTDYRIRAVPHSGGDALNLLVRLIPRENPDVDNKFTHHCVVLKKFFECGWQDEAERIGILEAVNDPKGELVFHRGETDEAKFWRIHSNIAYDCVVAVLQDDNGDGKVEKSEVTNFLYQLWDYHRETKDEAGQTMTEYLYVQQDTRNGNFEIWRGEEVLSSRITA